MKRALLLFCTLWSVLSWGTHNRAGEITYRWLGGRSYEARITTYTRSCNLCADRCELTLNWGDGNSDLLKRANGTAVRCNNGARDGEIIDPANEIRKNVYIGRHTYQAAGIYTLFFEDANRNAGISNIINSDQVPFYVETELYIAESFGGNSSPILTNPPVERGCTNRRFEHNAGAFDPDGDSLSFKLVLSKTTNGNPITTIYDPQFVQDSVKIDPMTGDLIWDVPQAPGQFNFAFQIVEWRKNQQGRYTKIGYVTRDLQVDIEECSNRPPKINPVGPFCIEAGQNLNFQVRATDPDNDLVELTAFGGPFVVTNPADPFGALGREPISATFNWNTRCNHVRKQPYLVTFKAEDDPADISETPLSDLHTTEIRVIAPAPKNPQVLPQEGGLLLSWDRSPCGDPAGYSIYRREGRFGFFPGQCETGVPAYTGYTLLDSNKLGVNDTLYLDTNGLELGKEYCYMVVAYFPDEGESYASQEFCGALPLSLPLFTKVDVLHTDPAQGRIQVEWVAPPELDSLTVPPPYRYRLLRSDSIDGSDFEAVGTFDGLLNTQYTDSLLNTQDLGYRYKLEFYSGPNLQYVGDGNQASSVFLRPVGSDQSVVLNMENRTPWRNQRFVIFRELIPGSGQFDSIAESYGPVYRDTGLTNGESYCYRVRSIGRYTASDSLPRPLRNNSQEACATARDTIAPCVPRFSLSSGCSDTLLFRWSEPANADCPNDISAYNIYFRRPEAPFGSKPVITIPADQSTGVYTFINDGDFFGCYAITAIDDAGNDPNGSPNESALSAEVCVSSCFKIRFPNVFTPNGDGQNRYFLPLEYNQVENLRLDIYNRWGTLVYQAPSLEALINPGWDGTRFNKGNAVPEGVYYYVCRYRPKTFGPGSEQVTSGFVHLFR